MNKKKDDNNENSPGQRPIGVLDLPELPRSLLYFPNRAELGPPQGSRRAKSVACGRPDLGSISVRVMATCDLQWIMNVVSGFIDPAMRF